MHSLAKPSVPVQAHKTSPQERRIETPSEPREALAVGLEGEIIKHSKQGGVWKGCVVQWALYSGTMLATFMTR